MTFNEWQAPVSLSHLFSIFFSDVPSPPVLNSLEKEVFSCNVSLAWETPSDHGCPLIMYTIYYMQIQPQQPGAPWYVVNITNAMANKYFLATRCDTEYKIEMTAWNEVGQSSRSKRGKQQQVQVGFSRQSYRYNNY